MNHNTPRSARIFSRTLLRLALHPDDRAFALADLDDEFDQRVTQDGPDQAVAWYRSQALRSVGPSLWGRWVRARTARQERRQRRKDMRNKGSRRPRGHRPDTENGQSVEILSNFLADLKYAARGVLRAPLTMSVTILSLGLGIGAVTVVFALANSLVLRPPVGLENPQELVTVYASSPGRSNPYGGLQYPDYLETREGLEAAREITAVSMISVDAGSLEVPRKAFGEEVTGNYFSVMGLQLELGRGILPEEVPGGMGAPVAVLGYDLWTRDFGADPDVLGRSIRLDGKLLTVVGVAAEGIMSRIAPLRTEVWVPRGSMDDPQRAEERNVSRVNNRVHVMARLAAGATLDQLQAQADVMAARLADIHPETSVDGRGDPYRMTVVSERSSRVNPRGLMVIALLGVFFLCATGLILLIACSNVASLFLARATSRSRELAVRLSLGASRRRLIAMLLTEGLVPGVAGAGVGVLVTVWAARALSTLSLPIGMPVKLNVGVDWRVVLFAVLVAVGTSLVFGLFPALEGSRPNLVPALKGEDGSVAGRKRRFNLRNTLVVMQCAASMVLLAGAMLFVRSLSHASQVDLGIDPTGVAVASRSLRLMKLDESARVSTFRSLRDDIQARPEVEAVALSRGLELTLTSLLLHVQATLDGTLPEDGGVLAEVRNPVTPGYLEILGIPILQGRDIAESDVEGASRVAVVNQTMAERFWPGENALGRTFQMIDLFEQSAEPLLIQVVGVARNGKYQDFDDPPTPYFWTSFYQEPSDRAMVVAKGRTSAEEMVPVLREAIALAPGEVQVMPPTTLASQISIQFIHLQIASTVLGWSGAFGLFLAVIGIYGIVSFAVTQRTREMAIRLAMGAEHAQVVRTILGDGMRLALIGFALGLAVIVPAAFAIRGIFSGISPIDPLSLGGASGVLLLSAALASVIPARRAIGISPMRTLREE